MKIYHLKVSLFYYCQIPINKLHRVIAISDNHTFEDLHDMIFEAFDRYDPHLYSFFLSKKDSKSLRDIMDAPCITNPYSFDNDFMFSREPKNAANTTLAQAKLSQKDVFHYWFDFGDDWWHRIRVEKVIDDASNQPVLEIIKKVGESPAQYPDDDDYE